MGRVGRYVKEVDEIIKERFVEGLKPQHKKAVFKNKQKKNAKKKAALAKKLAPKKKKKK